MAHKTVRFTLNGFAALLLLAASVRVARADGGAPTADQILDDSQVSYRADGGFTGVESYSVIISCVKGKISVMKSIHDPRLADDKARLRSMGTVDKEAYLRLWTELCRHAIFQVPDGPAPTVDIADEFTVEFFTKVGERSNRFSVRGISRPDAARYYAVRTLIDGATQMKSLWENHARLAATLDEPPAQEAAAR